MARVCEKGWLEAYLKLTQYIEPPGSFHLWTGLVLLSSVLARKVYMDRGLFKLYPNLYVALVGPTGLGKSLAGEIGVESFAPTVESVGVEIMSGKLTSWYLYGWFGTKSQTGDPAAALIFASEMKTLFGDLNRAELIAMLTDLYSCPEEADYRTKSYDVLKLKKVYINLLLCSVPEWISMGITQDDMSAGFPGRFVYVCEEETERSFPFPEDFYGLGEIDEVKGRLVEDLDQIAGVEGRVTLTNDAKARYTVWYEGRKSELSDERLRGYFARKRDHVLKVAALISVSLGDSLVVTERHLELAHSLLKGAESNMLMAFKGVVGVPSLRYRDVVLDQIVRAGEIGRDELLRRNSTRLDIEGLTTLLNTLEGEGRIKIELEGQDEHKRARFRVRST